MTPSVLRRSAIGAALLLAASSAGAATVSAVLSDINDPLQRSGYSVDLGSFRPFVFLLPTGARTLSATLGGTYGTAISPNSTEGFDAIVDGTRVTVCVSSDPGFWVAGTAFRPIGVALPSSLFASLADAIATPQVIATSGASVPVDFTQIVRWSSPKLTVAFAVPEPATWAMLVGSLGLAGAAMRRRRMTVAG